MVRHVLRDLSPQTTVCYLSGLQHDTQYKALTALCETLTGAKFKTGYHTAQLYTAFMQSLADYDLVIILDDIDFLLLIDGSDFLYYLSRIDHQLAADSYNTKVKARSRVFLNPRINCGSSSFVNRSSRVTFVLNTEVVFSTTGGFVQTGSVELPLRISREANVEREA